MRKDKTMENNSLIIFENPEFGQVRSVIINREPWFVAVDVCNILSLSNSRVATESLDEDEKADVRITYTSSNGTVQRRKVCAINEYGLYSLILKSRKPEAKAFKRWVTHDILPSIRKNGAYVIDAVLDHMDEHPELIPEYIRKLREENANARTAREALKKAKAEIALLAPKAAYYDSFVSIESLTNLRYTAKEIGVPQKKFIGYLLEKGYVFRDRHRKGRIFARAGKRNEPLFMTKDFYLPDGSKSEYTLITPAGKAHFLEIADKIRVWKPKDCEGGEEITEQAVFAE
jgi:prophage antirepressor-like protein